MCYSIASLVGVPPLTGTATLLISITDINDNPPRLLPPLLGSLPAVVTVSAVRGSTVYCFNATDADSSPPNIVFDYSVCSDPHCSDFTLQPGSASAYILCVGCMCLKIYFYQQRNFSTVVFLINLQITMFYNKYLIILLFPEYLEKLERYPCQTFLNAFLLIL